MVSKNFRRRLIFIPGTERTEFPNAGFHFFAKIGRALASLGRDNHPTPNDRISSKFGHTVKLLP
jgi:hypothetical protein